MDNYVVIMFIFCCSFIIVSIIKSLNIVNMVRKPDRKSVLLTLEQYWHGVGGKYDPTLQHMTPAATMDKFSNFTEIFQTGENKFILHRWLLLT